MKIIVCKNKMDLQDFKYFEFKQNKVSHQKKNTECGVYCLFFIIEMLKKEKPYMFEKEIPDEKMEKFRKEYFNLYM